MKVCRNTSNILCPYLCMVSRQERTMQKACAPSKVRQPPEIFCFTFGMRMARSARLLVNGTRKSVTKRSTASACSRRQLVSRQ